MEIELDPLGRQISEINKDFLFDDTLIKMIFALEDKVERERLLSIYVARAKELKLGTEVKAVFKALKDEEIAKANFDKKFKKIYTSEFALAYSSDGKPFSTIDNFLLVMRNDSYFQGVRFNLLSYSPEVHENNKMTKWADTDDAKAKHFIEAKYNFHSEAKYQDAIRIYFSEKEYHPIKKIIESIEWDGESHIANFLTKWAKCTDDDYTREVSRLIFAGGIHRVYNPGCKFDDVPVLIGDKQGEGKSTFVRWLAIKDDFFGEVSDIDGQKGIEVLEGLWICEIAEMLATTKAKEVEAVKAYITRQNDRYRKPFDRRVTDHPRQCIFIGTTNKEQFLTDKTGNRRFYPIKVNQIGYDLYNQEKEIKEDIKQCWAEAFELFKKGKLDPFAKRELKETINDKQNEAVEDDYREEMIQGYLEDKIEKQEYIVCILELYQKALNNDFGKPTRKESNEIVLIMNRFKLWEKGNVSIRFKEWGVQKIWQYKKNYFEKVLSEQELADLF